MHYQTFFKDALDDLRDQSNYRVFADLERHRGSFPRATARGDKTADVTIWCSNDYLSMGQHSDVLNAMHDARCVGSLWGGGWRHAQYFWNHP